MEPEVFAARGKKTDAGFSPDSLNSVMAALEPGSIDLY